MRRWHRTSLTCSGVNNTGKISQKRLKTVEGRSSSLAIEVKGLSSQKSLFGSAKARIEQQIQIMLQKVKRIVEWQGADLRESMNYVRSSVLFKQIDGIDTKIVDEIVGQYSKSKISLLKSRIAEKNKELLNLKEQIKEEKEFSQINLRSNSIFVNPKTDNIVFQLYQKAKEGSFEQFMIMYSKIHSQSKPCIQTKVKHHQNDLQNENPGKIKKSIQDYLKPLLQTLEESEKVYFLKLMHRETMCSRPCCKWGSEESSMPTPVQLFLTCKVPTNRSQSIYYNSQFNQYYSRYCGKEFKLSDVVSITRTHTEEMDKIYSKLKHKQKQKVRQHIRNRSIA